MSKYITIYTTIYNYIQIDTRYTRYIQNTRRRPGGGGPARPRGPPPPGILYISFISCTYLYILVYKLIYFGIKSIYLPRFPFEQVQVRHGCIFEFFPPFFPHRQINRTLPYSILYYFNSKLK